MPNAAVKAMQVPMVGTASMAKMSPYPYGIGVYVGGKPKTLYYISESVAEGKGHGVEEGWYVEAGESGEPFEIRISNVHKKGEEHFKGELFAENDKGASAKLFVDGFNTLGVNSTGGYQIMPGKAELSVLGFTTHEEFAKSSSAGKTVNIEFSFSPVEIVPDGEEPNLPNSEETGLIKMEIYVGDLFANPQASYLQNYKLAGTSKVSEKAAMKFGRSVQVARAGKTVMSPCHRMTRSVMKTNVHARVKVFIRERFWLESRHIIAADGSAWRPRIDEEVVVLDNDADTEEGGKGVAEANQAEQVLDATHKPNPASASALEVANAAGVNGNRKKSAQDLQKEMGTVKESGRPPLARNLLNEFDEAAELDKVAETGEKKTYVEDVGMKNAVGSSKDVIENNVDDAEGAVQNSESNDNPDGKSTSNAVEVEEEDTEVGKTEEIGKDNSLAETGKDKDHDKSGVEIMNQVKDARMVEVENAEVPQGENESVVKEKAKNLAEDVTEKSKAGSSGADVDMVDMTESGAVEDGKTARATEKKDGLVRVNSEDSVQMVRAGNKRTAPELEKEDAKKSKVVDLTGLDD